jgi:hypothetical protein
MVEFEELKKMMEKVNGRLLPEMEPYRIEDIEKTKHEIIVIHKAMTELEALGELGNKPSVTAAEWENMKERLYNALLEVQTVCGPEKA